MSRKEVEEQVYPDEIPIIFEQYAERQKISEMRRCESYLWQMRAVIAGMGGKTKSGESLYEIFSKQLVDNIQQLAGEEEKSFDITTAYYEYEELQSKDNRTAEENDRMNELKQKMNEHIDGEINKLRKVNQKPRRR